MTAIGLLVMLSIGCVTMLSVSCSTGPSVEATTLSIRLFTMKVNDAGLVSSEYERDNLIAFCNEYGINRVLIQVDIARIGDAIPSVRHGDKLASFVHAAASHGITVEALQTNIDTTISNNPDRLLAALSAITSFNQTLPSNARFVGVHYDLKPHLLDSWQNSKRPEAMTRYLDFLQTVRTRLAQHRSALRVSATVPFWYDSRIDDEDSCLVDFYGSTKNFHEHIQDLTDYAVITCHRQQAGNPTRFEDLIETELDYAHWIGSSVGIGIETARQTQSPEVSFYGRPAWEFWQQQREAIKALDNRQGFTGVVMNDYKSFKHLVAQQPVATNDKPETSRQMFGMWLWHEKWVRAAEAQDQVLAFCEEHGINLLHVQFHIDPGSVKRGRPELRYPEMLRRFVDRASSLGIKIEALDGAPEMALAENRASVLAVVNTIIAFNKTLPHMVSLSGIHFDIEPYLLPQWKTPGRHEVMYQNLQLLEAVALKLKLDAPQMTLSTSIPFWYDEKTAAQDSCIIEYDGQRKNFHEHIQDLTDYIVIMSYRRNALGDDSIVRHIEVERAYAEWIGKEVCAGMETLEIKDRPEVSFHGLPAAEFWFQKQKLDHALSNQGGYGGTVVHSYETFKPYLDRQKAN